MFSKSPGGETGRHTAFRARRRKACLFDAGLGHHLRKIGREDYCRCLESRSVGRSPARGFESFIFHITSRSSSAWIEHPTPTWIAGRSNRPCGSILNFRVYSSTGRVSVSKTEGCGFNSLCARHHFIVGVPEWSKGADCKSACVMHTQVRILSPTPRLSALNSGG